MERLQAIKQQLITVFGDMSMAQRVSLGVALVVVLGGLGWVITSATQVDYRTLYSDVSEETASKMTEALRKQNIPYELDGPTTIKVPHDQLYDARLYVAGLGLTDNGGAGYELFDESDFGMTTFTQKINYKRAMENELARTVRHLETIRDARVHLVLPEESLFKDEQEEPSASVVLTLHGGRMPSDDQIASIRYLVGSAVEGLEAEQVTVVDSGGRLLARPSGTGLMAGSGAGSMEAARQVEIDLEERIVDLLAPMVGRDGLRAKVRVELDTAQVTETAEIFDPEATAVRSEQRTEEIANSGATVAGGVPGIGSNLPGRDGAGDGGVASNARNRTDERINYEVSKTVRSVTNSGYEIKRLSVAVLVDDLAANAPVPAPGEGAEGADEAAAAATVAAALTPERVEGLVKGAVGFDDARGDVVQVSFEPFVASAQPAAALPWYQEPQLVVPTVRYAALLLLALLLILLVARPLGRMLKTPELATAQPAGSLEVDVEVVGQRVGDLSEAFGSEASDALDSQNSSPYAQLRAEILELGKSDIDKTGQVIRQWIRADV